MSTQVGMWTSGGKSDDSYEWSSEEDSDSSEDELLVGQRSSSAHNCNPNGNNQWGGWVSGFIWFLH